jgi:predicted O-linked N-acetylglucosamine transferase (SPINDLY family)
MNLGSLLRQTGRTIDAIGLYRHALVYEPRNTGVLSNLGHALSQTGLYQEAIETLRRAIETDPNSHTAWDNLGHCYSRLERYDDAGAALTKAVQINPRNANAWNNLGGVRLAQCQVEEAISCFRKAVELDPANAMARSNILFALNFSPNCTAKQMAEQHRAWHEQHATALAGEVPKHPPRDIQKSPLRVGFVSPDFCEHPVGRFLASLFRGRTGEDGWQAICYSDVLVPDARTQWLRGRCDEWRDTAGLSDRELARVVLQDRIDILIDLAGHTGRNRLLMFARKPAPVQASWLGYINTTGLRTMDYLISDSVCIPEEAEHLYTEKIIRLPDDFVCYEPPPVAPPVNELPALKRGYVTFGGFNQVSKVSDSAMRVWADVMHRLPTARLVLGGKAFNDKSIIDYFLRKFTAVGLSADRLILLPKTSVEKYLARYHEVDISLDPFPCAGGATTCDSLWMGVPVVTFTGDRFAGRHSASHVHNAGLGEIVAEDVDGYVRIALELANDLERLATIRATLRDKMAQSPLCDPRRFADNFSKALRTMWSGEKG